MHPEFDKRELWVKTMKDAAVASVGPDENDDMPPVVDVLAKGKPAVTVMCRDVSRDQGLFAAVVGVSGFAGDELWLVLDSHMSNSLINPTTGEKWGPGEMQAGCEGEQMCSLGIITDCMMIHYAHRDGARQMSVLPYHVHKNERTIRWVDEEVARMGDDPETSKFDGLVLDGINQAFDTPITKDIIATSPSLTIGERLQASVIAKQAAVLALQREGHTVSVAEETILIP